jgi:hypothetical protein
MKKNAISKALNSAKAKQAKAKENEKYVDSLLAVPAKDTTNVLAVQADNGNVADSASGALDVPQLPTPEELGISITTGYSGDTLQVAKGDTIDFPITVSWKANGGSILVLPTSSANTKDLSQVGLSQESSRIVKDGQEIAQITFNYKLVVKDDGVSAIPAMRFEIPTPMGQSLYLRSDPVVYEAKDKSESFLTVLGIVFVLFWVVVKVLRIRQRKKAKALLAKWNGALVAIRERMMVLKQRVNVADSREWLLELESVCKGFVALRFGIAEARAATINLDNLVKDGKLEGWEHLVEEFAHARYGGGVRDSFENKETWKLAMQLMDMEEE